ncbi:MAG TPA: glycosyl hydrolase family 18 protein, partial [Terriglobales bacterium]|nr:glycosyl hydrolase family 18 protein [Terriglobales bacterium]
AFSRFVTEAAGALHRHGRLLSVAVGARTTDDPTTYTYRTFSGVYDYRALSGAADFLSVMAYPESDSSHPGPLASVPWVEQVIQHVLLQVPADKFSLGLPTYQTDWSERRVRVTLRERIAGKIKRVFHYIYKLIHHNGAVVHPDGEELRWDPVLQSSYHIEGEGHSRHITWVEDERSFAAKLKLVAQYHLRGFSVWRIGLEDPHIWTELPAVERVAKAADPTAPVLGH